ncbi:hypothetical protein Y032_0020g230 [Ancylostoma ceylanicum]|uniref:ALG11 mannosyltransferase N-terminal domain-containing protein n=1 Tax=Ancylostoma ceylanicum TaxID=53326 RepID=A0A016V0E6_9BILA|nr:hypothetical protein Y032_0020g230 [Ancylostoma ceylanicum]
MIDLVSRREQSYNNADFIVQSNILSHAKLAYYRLFAFFYGLAGQAAEVVMVNGSWTGGHIKRIWRRNDVSIVFPPCDVSSFLTLEQNAEDKFAEDRIVRIMSIGQIRPEKNHRMQIEVLRMVKKELEKRGDGTEESLISIHTMWNEHFGISVVEGMAAGTIMLAHDSGGPQLDILQPIDGKKQELPLGFLAATKEGEVVGIVRCMLFGALIILCSPLLQGIPSELRN